MLGPQAALLATVLVHILSPCLPWLAVLQVIRIAALMLL